MLANLVYFLHDEHQSDQLDCIHIRSIIETIHQKSYDTSSAVRHMMESMDKQYAQVTVKQFKVICKNNHNILSPISNIQFILRKAIKGDVFWAKMCKNRENDPRMANIEFVYQCQRECEEIRVQRARVARLDLISDERERIRHKPRLEEAGGGGAGGGGGDGGSRRKRAASEAASAGALRRSISISKVHVADKDHECDDDVEVEGAASTKLKRRSSSRSKLSLGRCDDEGGSASGAALKRSSLKKKTLTEDDGKESSKKSRPKSAKTSGGDERLRRKNTRESTGVVEQREGKSEGGGGGGHLARASTLGDPAVHDGRVGEGEETVGSGKNLKRSSLIKAGGEHRSIKKSTSTVSATPDEHEVARGNPKLEPIKTKKSTKKSKSKSKEKE